MTANDYYDWKKHPVTQLILIELERRYNVLREELVDQAFEISHEQLCDKAGGAKAYRDILSISFDEIFEESQTDGD